VRPQSGPFRPPPVGRLLVKATRDDAFGAELLLAVEGVPSPAGVRLSGSLRGPDCSRATTLPVTVPLVPVASPLGVAARAVLTEPATWTPELPNRYRLEARLEGCDALLEASLQPFGGWLALRRLGVRGRSFRLDGRRFVLRGGPPVAMAAAAESLPAAREAIQAVVVDADDPGFTADASLERLLEAADRDGTLVALKFSEPQSESLASSTAFHPAAGFVIARDREAASAFASCRTPSGPLLGLAVDGGSPPPSDAGPADFLVVRLAAGELPDDAWLARPPRLPLVACRGADAGTLPRPEGPWSHPCDDLQRTLARWGVERSGPVLPWDWSGYLIERASSW
jgi:hypothetical protein